MRRVTFLLIVFLISIQANGQQVPSRMQFADIELHLTAGAIKDIQADVDAMTRSEKYFQIKLQRVDMYMPIIERIFAEEGLPDDFKYLVIQESALISDAVSSSNAVGFWQFKEISGLENDLRIDRTVDERMNIVSSSRAAATYLKSHNSYFDNWAYSLIAYQKGRWGAEDVVDKKNFGEKKLRITSDTYWYLKKFLAHKIAFENALGSSEVPYFLKEKTDAGDMKLDDIAKEYKISPELLEEYNKWLKRGRVPTDKNYAVIIPLKEAELIAKNKNHKPNRSPYKDLPGEVNSSRQDAFPVLGDEITTSNSKIAHEIEINGKKGILAVPGYTVASLAEKGGLSERKFRKFNDMSATQALNYGSIYYLKRKRNRAKFYYHTVKAGESMWEISQKYALKLHKLYRKNRMEAPSQPKDGRVLWLRMNRPADIPIEYEKLKKEDNSLKEDTMTSLSERDIAVAEINKGEKAEEKKPTKELTPIEDPATSPAKEEPAIFENAAEDSLALASPPVQKSSKTQADSEAVQNQDSEFQAFPKEQEQFTEEQEERPELIIYEIRKGDTFFSISNRFNMRISDLLEFNQLNIRDTLSIGQKISVNANQPDLSGPDNPIEEPGSANPGLAQPLAGKTSAIEHRVANGETLYALAKKYEVSLKELMQWNEKSDYSINEGEIIIIKKN